MLRCQIRSGSGTRTTFQLRVRNDNRRPKLVTLCAPLDIDDPAAASTINAARRGLSAQRHAHGDVAQISNLLYRRFVIGRALNSGWRAEPALALQNGILRYVRRVQDSSRNL
jgi:hypothetical protein